MKSKKLLLPTLILLIALLAAVAVNIALSIAKKPAIAEKDFQFSVTYEYNGKLETVEGVCSCSFNPENQSVDPLDRFYSSTVSFGEEANADNHRNYLIAEDKDGQLVIITCLDAGYLMGDPQYEEDAAEDHRPYIAYYDSEGVEYSDEATLKKHGVRLVSWEYPEPIENEFVFSHLTRIHVGSVIPTVIVGYLALLLCFVLVKKENDIAVGSLYQLSTILNFIVGIVVIPALTLICALLDVNGDGSGIVSQICYCVPALSALCLAASVALRRKGYAKSGLIAQFVGPVVFAVMLAIDTVALMIA